MSIFKRPTEFDFMREPTPHEVVSSQSKAILDETTDTLDAFQVSNKLLDAVLSVKSAYDALFQPNIYSKANNMHRLAASYVDDTLCLLKKQIESVKGYYRYQDTSYSFLKQTVVHAELVYNNITELLELVGELELVNVEKKEYNLAEILNILKGNSVFTLESNKLLDASCYNDKDNPYVFDYQISFRNDKRDTFIITYTSPFPMHSIKLIESYIKKNDVDTLPYFKVKKI